MLKKSGRRWTWVGKVNVFILMYLIYNEDNCEGKTSIRKEYIA
ncbi:hypothetical protein QY97_01614 [Bacillus thermotolerans]|nr:hypothetical protein QY97_01614 [Bacillus thermotolerans]